MLRCRRRRPHQCVLRRHQRVGIALSRMRGVPRTRTVGANELGPEVIEEAAQNLVWGGRFAVDVWRAVLTSVGVNDGAQLQLVLFSQASEEALTKANGIVGQLLDGYAKEPSSFVHRAVQNERSNRGLS